MNRAGDRSGPKAEGKGQKVEPPFAFFFLPFSPCTLLDITI
jgi:hypothetical protein